MFSLIITSSTVIVQLISQIARLTPFDRENVFQFWGRGQKFNVKVSKREKVEEKLDGVGIDYYAGSKLVFNFLVHQSANRLLSHVTSE